MTKLTVQEFVVETMVVSFSAGFLAWYILAKVAVWPWGASSF